jgi:UDP-N-acetyl-2-amino-2-deoxyglucuronate dehydrogenase
MALRVGANAICEKPLVINPWNLDALEALEAETGRGISTILQLRLHPALVALKDRIAGGDASHRYQVRLTYVTARGRWYQVSWKGIEERSGGLATNIGIHFFDLLIWLFGAPVRSDVHVRDEWRTGGELELERADISWFMSTDPADLPFEAVAGQQTTFRSIRVDNEEVEFSGGFTDLHTRSYQEILAGHGFGIAEARPSIALAHLVREQPLTPRPIAGGGPPPQGRRTTLR